MRFGFIGCGSISHYHAQVVLALGHEICGVCAKSNSENLNRFSNEFSVKNRYLNWKELIQDQQPDALIVAVSWDQTEDIISDILRTEIPCLIEKPIALTSSKLEAIIAENGKSTGRVMVGYNRRFYNSVKLIEESIKSEQLLSINLNCPERLSDLIEKKGSNITDHILIYMTSHWLDLLLYLLGDIDVKQIYKTIDNDSQLLAYNGLFATKNNIPIHFQANFNTPSNTGITFNFKDKIYQLSPIERLQVFDGLTVVDPDEENPIRQYVPRIKEEVYVETTYKPGFFKQMENFIECCINQNNLPRVGCNLSEALSVTKLCNDINEKALEVRLENYEAYNR